MQRDAEVTGSFLTTGNVEFCYFAPNAGPATWTAGGAMITARTALAGAGTQESGLAFGGQGVAPTFTILSCTEEYNGSSWSAGGALITARLQLAGAGIQNSALAFGGNTPTILSCTEEYNGSSWITGGALGTSRYRLAGAGTQNTGLAIGGYSNVGLTTCTEEYDGASWSAGGALSTARYYLAGAGAQNAALAIGGFDNSNCLSCTEEYDGASWSAGGALINARENLAGVGTQNAGLAIGGGFPGVCTEEYNGTSWSTGGALITARVALGGAGTQKLALAFGGAYSSIFSCTEEYTGAQAVEKTFDYSVDTGITTVSCLIETSAKRYKDNIQELTSQLNKINQLKPVEFDWKTSRKHDIGFIAEDVAKVYPEIVKKNEVGEVEGISYSKMVAALIKAIQEQQQQLSNLAKKIDNLSN
jgi:hypothetical protein